MIRLGHSLAQRQYPHHARHFGLGLLESAVKYRWNELDHEALKQAVMDLYSTVMD